MVAAVVLGTGGSGTAPLVLFSAPNISAVRRARILAHAML